MNGVEPCVRKREKKERENLGREKKRAEGEGYILPRGSFWLGEEKEKENVIRLVGIGHVLKCD